MMRFGDYLKSIRIRKNLTLRELSTSVNLGYSYLSEIENNKKSAPNDRALLLLADVLNLNARERVVFFDAAAKSKQGIDKNNFHIPADIGEYISLNKKAKLELRNNLNNGKNNK